MHRNSLTRAICSPTRSLAQAEADSLIAVLDTDGSGNIQIASLQASEAIKILTHNWASVSRCMVHVDLASLTFRQLDVTTSDECGACPCCGQHRFDYLDGKHASRTTKLCGRNAVQLARAADAGSIALEALAERLSAYGPVRCNELMLWARVQDGDRSYELTVFENGRAIVKGTEDPATARSVYARFVGG